MWASSGHLHDVRVSRQSDALAARHALDRPFSVLLVGLSAVAMLVGGVGVATTMVVAGPKPACVAASAPACSRRISCRDFVAPCERPGHSAVRVVGCPACDEIRRAAVVPGLSRPDGIWPVEAAFVVLLPAFRVVETVQEREWHTTLDFALEPDAGRPADVFVLGDHLGTRLTFPSQTS